MHSLVFDSRVVGARANFTGLFFKFDTLLDNIPPCKGISYWILMRHSR